MQRFLIISAFICFLLIPSWANDERQETKTIKTIRVSSVGTASAHFDNIKIKFYLYDNSLNATNAFADLQGGCNGVAEVVSKFSFPLKLAKLDVVSLEMGGMSIASSQDTIDELFNAGTAPGFCVSRSICIKINGPYLDIALALVDKLISAEIFNINLLNKLYTLRIQFYSNENLLLKARENNLVEAKTMAEDIVKCLDKHLGAIVNISDTKVGITNHISQVTATVESDVYFCVKD